MSYLFLLIVSVSAKKEAYKKRTQDMLIIWNQWKMNNSFHVHNNRGCRKI